MMLLVQVSLYHDSLIIIVREIVFQILMNVLKILVIKAAITLLVPLHVHVTMDMS